jgi:hypothetical protein
MHQSRFFEFLSAVQRPLTNQRKESFAMKRILLLLILSSMSQWGCQFLGGAAVGAAATGAGYEIQAKRQMDRLEDDYKHERISRKEYEQRKKQIEAGSIIY